MHSEHTFKLERLKKNLCKRMSFMLHLVLIYIINLIEQFKTQL